MAIAPVLVASSSWNSVGWVGPRAPGCRSNLTPRVLASVRLFNIKMLALGGLSRPDFMWEAPRLSPLALG